MSKAMRTVPLVTLFLSCTGCFDGPKVLQGEVLSYSPQEQILVVRDEVSPNAEFRFSLAEAQIGAQPEAGDVVRLTYRETGDPFPAGRVMNISRQKDH